MFSDIDLKIQDLRPGDVSGKRNLWEKQSVEKPAASSSKVTHLHMVKMLMSLCEAFCGVGEALLAILSVSWN